jgi:hypothetical protein
MRVSRTAVFLVVVCLAAGLTLSAAAERMNLSQFTERYKVTYVHQIFVPRGLASANYCEMILVSQSMQFHVQSVGLHDCQLFAANQVLKAMHSGTNAIDIVAGTVEKPKIVHCKIIEAESLPGANEPPAEPLSP